MLDSLRFVDGIEDVVFYASVEPNDVAVLDLAKSVDFCEAHWNLNETVLGPHCNIYAAMLGGCELGADYVVHVEEDVLVSPDLLRYHRWCRDRYRDDPTVYAICSHSHLQPDRTEYHAVWKRKWFAPWSWGIWADRFQMDIPSWDFTGGKGGWDWNINLNLRGPNRTCVFPLLSRVQHIGVVGAYSNEENFHFSAAPGFELTTQLPAGEFHEIPPDDRGLPPEGYRS